MKRISLILLTSLLSLSVFAQEADSIGRQSSYTDLLNEVNVLREENRRIQSDYQSLLRRINSVESSIKEINGDLSAVETRSKELDSNISQNAAAISASKSELGAQIEDAKNTVDSQSKSIKTRTIWGGILAAIVLALSALITLLLHKKGVDRIDELRAQSDKINEEIVNRFATEMSDMQKISTSISALSSAGASAESEQDLIKTLADRITFMEMTLYRMDNSVKGHKQLTRSIVQMKDNLKASGYELVEMLGKTYSDGMKAVASFEEDESLEKGARIITKVIKPQINYNGVMIQNAQITVTQNI